MATTRSVRVLAAGFTASLALVAASPAAAQDPAETGTVNGSAFGALLQLSGNDVISRTPLVTLPADGTAQNESLVTIPLSPLLEARTLNARTEGDPAAGTSSATGSAAEVEVLPPLLGGTPLPGVPLVTEAALSADVISATCTATPDGETGSATLTDLRAGGSPIGVANPGPNTVIAVPGLASVVLNEQINNPDGSLTVNALHVTLLSDFLNPNSPLVNIIVGSATCGQNSAAPPINAIPTAGLPIAAGLVAAFALGVVVMRRREMGPFAA